MNLCLNLNKVFPYYLKGMVLNSPITVHFRFIATGTSHWQWQRSFYLLAQQLEYYRRSLTGTVTPWHLIDLLPKRCDPSHANATTPHNISNSVTKQWPSKELLSVPPAFILFVTLVSETKKLTAECFSKNDCLQAIRQTN